MLTSRLRSRYQVSFLLCGANTKRLFFSTPLKCHGRRFRAPLDPFSNKSRQPAIAKPPATKTLINTNVSRPRLNSSFEYISYSRPLIFGGAMCVSTFIIAGVIYDRNQQTLWQRWTARLRQQGERSEIAHLSWQWWSSWVNGGDNDQYGLDSGSPSWGNFGEFWQAKQVMVEEKRREWSHRMDALLQDWQQSYGLPEGVRRLIWMVTEKYASMTGAECTLAGLIGINILVFGAWQVPRWSSFMGRWFMHNPANGRHPVTLITSCFSHQEGLHLACNMVGLWSFGSLMHDYLGREQFLALYLTMGIGANIASHTLSLALRRSRPLVPSLGASGAIYGLLSSTAYMKPEASISLIFLPFYPIKLSYALPALMGFDVAGILLKWKMFDHYAHLAGASIGLGYMAYGQQYVWHPLVKHIHDIRSKQATS